MAAELQVMKLYRYEDVQYAGSLDEYDNIIPGSGTLRIHLREYLVLRETPKGVWINHHGKEKFVLNRSKKRFAHPTKEEALKSFKRRKKSQLLHLEHQLARAKKALFMAENLKEELWI